MAKKSHAKVQSIFDNGTGRLVAQGPTEAGKRSGGWVHWYPSGECRAMGHFANGREDGLWTYWYKNGQKAAEGHYAAGIEVGRWCYWYDHGVVMAEGEYAAGETHGRWIRRAQDGRLSKCEDWHHGQLIRRLAPLYWDPSTF